MTHRRWREGEAEIEVSAVFVAVTREAGGLWRTAAPLSSLPSPPLPQPILHRSDLTDGGPTVPPPLYFSTPVISVFVPLIVQPTHCLAQSFPRMSEKLRGGWGGTAVLWYHAGFSGFRLTEGVNI